MLLQNVNILQVLPALHNGGVERGTLEVAKAIIAAGGRAVVASNGGRLVAELEKMGGIHVELPLHQKNPLKILKLSKALQQVCLQYDIDLIHARSRAPAWTARRVARALKVPFVTTYHGVYSGNNFLKRYYNSIMARGDRVIAVSHFIERYIQQQHPKTDNGKVQVIPRGVDIEVFNRALVTPHRREVLRKEWRLKEGKSTIVIPGRISRWKGQDLAVKALGQLAEKYKELDWQVVFIGNGSKSYMHELQVMVAKHGIAKRVIWAGTISDMPAAYSLADLVVCPSTRPEAFGRTVIEAQALMVPVVGINHGGASETIVDNSEEKTGWHVMPQVDEGLLVEELAETIKEVLEMPAAAVKTVTDAAAKKVIDQYTTWKMTESILGVYKQLLEEQS